MHVFSIFLRTPHDLMTLQIFSGKYNLWAFQRVTLPILAIHLSSLFTSTPTRAPEQASRMCFVRVRLLRVLLRGSGIKSFCDTPNAFLCQRKADNGSWMTADMHLLQVSSTLGKRSHGRSKVTEYNRQLDCMSQHSLLKSHSSVLYLRTWILKYTEL